MKLVQSFRRHVGALPKRRLAAIAAAAFLGWKSYFVVNPDEFGIRLTLGDMHQNLLDPGFYLKVPFAQSIHSYKKNTQIIDYTAGGCRWWVCENTADRNTLYARMRLHYRVDPQAGPIGNHRWAMDGWVRPDGYWSITDLMNDSVNAVMGKTGFGETAAQPEAFATAFMDDLTTRLKQNNLPVTAQRLEFLGYRGSMFDPYDAPAVISRGPRY